MAERWPGIGVDRKQMASRLRERYQWLNSFTDDELTKVSTCKLEEGDVQQAEVYFDLSHPEWGHFRGQPGVPVPDGSCFVAQTQIDKNLWNKLVGQFGGNRLNR
ncbi:MAG: hypothetical protein HY675_14635 [Chloroflexi bacterium]|nr:hypothetical protein [Chloroflexota bacterium]